MLPIVKKLTFLTEVCLQPEHQDLIVFKGIFGSIDPKYKSGVAATCLKITYRTYSEETEMNTKAQLCIKIFDFLYPFAKDRI